MDKSTVLVVEDDLDILNLVTYHLKAAGMDVTGAQDGTEALAIIKNNIPDLIVLDIMLPSLSGLEVCKVLKRETETSEIPVVMLTARTEETDRIVGFELGADDYVVKPFSPRELVLRVQAVLRRSQNKRAPESVWQKEGLRIEVDSHRMTIDGEDVELTATEFKLLLELVRNRGRVQSRDWLLDNVWGYQFNGYARTVDTHIRRLRQKLGRYAEWVETIRGVGYRFRG